MDTEERFQLITKDTEEVLTQEDLRWMLQAGVPLKHYIGFEVSGKVHLGTGLMTGKKIADLQKAKVQCTCYLATWHAWINNKFGGDLDIIRKASAYFAESLKSSIRVMGGDPEKVSFITGDELYHHNDLFWETTIDVAKHMTLNRAMRAISIMGREEGGEVPLAFLLYPPMQVADIFVQGVNLAHAGMDQRKAHVVAREVATKIRNPLRHDKKPYKPVAIHHHLIMGLQKPTQWPFPIGQEETGIKESMKMSKSITGSAVFVHDTPDEIQQKMMTAFCPEGEVGYNPVLDWAKHLLFAKSKFVLNIERPAKFGGNTSFHTYAELEQAVAKKQLHPLDLKKAMAQAITDLLDPVRTHFAKGKPKKLLEEVKSFLVSR